MSPVFVNGQRITMESASEALATAPAHTAQQRVAIDKVTDWYHHSPDQVFRLFGYAGTGKTTIARNLAEALGLGNRALYAAYTGKAAHVLRTKGCTNARTVHSLIYRATEKVRVRLNELIKLRDRESDPVQQDILDRNIATEEAKLAMPAFILNEESELGDAPLLVLDEVSMVGRQMAADLMSFGTKLLVLGDPAQLPPVDGGGYFINHAPDHLLTEIHRSALDSPVTRMATAVRTSQPGDRTLGLDGPDGDSGRLSAVPGGPAGMLDFDQIIVWKNSTRWNLTHLARAMTNRGETLPQPGERIMVLANNARHAVFNGQQFTVCGSIVDANYPDILHLTVTDEDGAEQVLPTWTYGFLGLEGEQQAKQYGRDRTVAATFGQVITCHKAQGSQWNRVLVIDETRGLFGMTYRRNADEMGAGAAAIEAHVAAQRWMYTAVTRACEQIVVAGGSR